MAQRVQLREVVELSTGTRNPIQSQDETFVYVDVTAVDNETKSIVGARGVLGSEAPSRARKVIRKGDILVSTVRPNLNAVAMVPSALDGQRAGTGFAVLRATAKALPEYLFFFARSPIFVQRLSGLVAGAMYPAVTDKQVLDQELPLPNLDEQRRIVDILSRAEGIVRLQRQAAQKAREIIPALFLDMFGDPAANPKGWTTLPLHEVCEISYGIADKLDTSITVEQGIRILTISNVLLEGAIDPTVHRYCKPTDDQIRKCSVQRGDLLFNWRNGSETHIGKTAIWESDLPVLHVSFLLRLRPTTGRLNSYLLWAMLNLLRAREFFLNASRQQVNRKFNASELSALSLPIPPKVLQDRFAIGVEQVRSIQNQQTTATEKTKATFEALLAQVFSQPL